MSDPFEEWKRRMDAWREGWNSGFWAGAATVAAAWIAFYILF